MRQKVKEGENSRTVAMDDEGISRRKCLIVWLEKSFGLAAILFLLSFWAVALHNFFNASVFAFTCPDFRSQNLL